MTVPEITNLRKEGQVEKAYAEAKVLLENNHNDRYAIICMAWCIKSLAEKYATDGDYTRFVGLLIELSSLPLSEIGEQVIINSFAWEIKTLLQKLHDNYEILQNAAENIFCSLKKLPFVKPHRNYTLVLDSFLKIRTPQGEHWSQTDKFIDWWGLDNFLPEDYKPIALNNGKELSPIAERCYSAYYKAIAHRISQGDIDSTHIEEFVSRLDAINKSHPEYSYVLYHQALLLLSLDRKDDALNAIRPFVIKRQNEFWVWDLISDITDDNEIKLSCLCRALSCKTKPEYLGKVRVKTAKLMLENGLYENARTEIEEYIKVYASKKWHISMSVYEMTRTDWYRASTPLRSNETFYRNHLEPSESFLFNDIKITHILITHHNKEKGIYSFVTADKRSGFFYAKGINVRIIENNVYNVRLAFPNSPNKPTPILTITAEQKPENTLFFKVYSGHINKIKDKSFGFVDDIFISPELLSQYHLLNGDAVEGNAVISYNRKKESWGWKAISIKPIK